MHRLFTIAVALLAFSTMGEAQAGCEKDTDCKGERICESGACVDPPSAKPAEDAPADENAAAETPATEDAPAAEEAPPAETDPKDWWKEASRKTEVPILQAIFDEMPRPVRNKGGGHLVYKRAVPVVIHDIHTTTTRWGGKGQVGVHFLGISKVHTTTTLDPISSDTPGIPYCPVNCARITEVKTVGDQLSLLYDGPIKEWAGNVGDNAAGYIRQVGKQHKETCSLPVLYNHAPKNSWLDPEQVQAVKDKAVAEIKRYCGMD